MRLKLPFKLKDLTTNRGIATIYLVMMCVQLVAIEGYGVSNVKVALMALAPLLLIFKVPYMTKATVLLLLRVCLFSQVSESRTIVRTADSSRSGSMDLTVSIRRSL